MKDRSVGVRSVGLRAGWPGFAIAACTALLSAACGVNPDNSPFVKAAPLQSGGMAGMASMAALAAPPAGPTCVGTGAHDRHAVTGFDCAVCHPCGGTIQIATLTLPGGTSTAGSTVVVGSGSTPTTCTVACHFPMGAAPHSVAWNAGPLACTSCHTSVLGPPGMVVVSSHPGLGTGGVATCTSCHDMSAHTSGTPSFVGGLDATCASCHAGTGSTLLGVTPPLLVGWTDTANGDFHGARAGTGFGGSLLPPYSRAQPSLACTSCHDAHASGNAFLLASTVNGATLPAGTINRAGVGGQALCQACHSGGRHDACAVCHGTDPKPAGAACFTCHGHEGVPYFAPPPVWTNDRTNTHGEDYTDCRHCHQTWTVPVEYVPPVILASGRVTVDALAQEATLSWDTSEMATSFVEWGTSQQNFVAGDAVLTFHHMVRIAGLTENTAYTFRVRSSDTNRNLAFSAIGGFTTICPTCLPASITIANPGFELPVTALTEQTGAWWRVPGETAFCGRFASSEMTGANVFRISATGYEVYDPNDDGYVYIPVSGAGRYRLTKADIDAGHNVTFDVRPKALFDDARVWLNLVAYDSTGAVITDTANLRNQADIIGVSASYAYSGLRIASPVVNTTYARTLDVKAFVTNGLKGGKTWTDVSKVWLGVEAASLWPGQTVDVYFDNFR